MRQTVTEDDDRPGISLASRTVAAVRAADSARRPVVSTPSKLAGIIWALTLTEGVMLLVGLVLWLAFRRAIARGLAQGSPARAEQVFEPVAD